MNVQEKLVYDDPCVGFNGYVISNDDCDLRVCVAGSDWPAKPLQGDRLLSGTRIKAVARLGIFLIVETD